jgi:molybdopterin adenylyltransferase
LVSLIYDDKKRLNDKHHRKNNFVCHSERSEESPTFIEFFTRHIYDLSYFKRYDNIVKFKKTFGRLIMEKAKIGVLTISDRASKGIYEDISGKAIIDYLNDVLITPYEVDYRVIPDELELIKETLIDMIDNKGCSLILTTGGTGPAKRDVTPEATEAVCEKMMPGFGELMRQVSLSQVPTAILSRQTAGIRKKCLIVNLPGKPQSIKLCLDAVMPAIPYCIDLIEGAYIDTDPDKIKSFRPKNK